MITFKRRTLRADGALDELEPAGSDPSPDPGGDADDRPSDDGSADADRDLSSVAADTPTDPDASDGAAPRRPMGWARVLGYAVLPGLAMVLAGATGYTKWRDESPRAIQSAQVESVAAARQSTIKLLSYQPDTVEKDLGAARDGLTGQFRDSYTALTHDVVIPGAKQRHISAVATVPAAASVSASQSRATVLLFINQSIIVGSDAPSSTASTVKVTLDKVGARWLISGFDPI
jgi:Mce-associated membrane protein